MCALLALRLEHLQCLGLNAGAYRTYNHKKGKLMTNTDSSNRDSAVDAWAIFIILVIVVATAVFWVSGQ